MEARLVEIDRARAIYSHGSQISDPRVNQSYWKRWQEFEVTYGNEDMFREMLRIKRSVQAQFNTQVSWWGLMVKCVFIRGNVDEMKALEERAKKIAEEAKMDQPRTSKSMMLVNNEATAEMEQLAKANTNPEEINIGVSDEDEPAKVEKVRLEQQTIPSAVFGSIPEETQGEVLGQDRDWP
ncbi:hypothetical protein EMCRGX_G020263 [Ephydatia muelleri]